MKRNEPKKFANSLSEAEAQTLREAFKHAPWTKMRIRAQTILLSARGYDREAIADIQEINRDTVTRWINDWERDGIIGLRDDPRSGRPRSLTDKESSQIEKLIEADPRSLKRVLSQGNLGISLTTLRRLVKDIGLVWKRVRKSVKSKRDPDEFVRAAQCIKQLLTQQSSGQIDLFFFDESGFSLEPVVPYAWQPVGKTLEVPASKSKRLNLLGFLSVDMRLDCYTIEGKIDKEVVVACFDAFCKKCTQKTWVIVDNAPQHTSHLFQSKLAAWQQAGLHVFYLPTYSPELNLIEILWRFIKYHWLPFGAYQSYEALKNAVNEVLCNIGKKFSINFSDSVFGKIIQENF